MAVKSAFFVVNALVVEPINADLTCGVNDLIALHDDADVNNFTFVVLEESQVARLGLVNKIH